MKTIHSAGLYSVFAICIAAAATCRAADPTDAEKKIAELYKSGKLFDEKQYKTVRAAFSQQFEETQKAAIKDAFGDDYDKLTEWLKKRPEVKEELYTALDPTTDKVQTALTLFKQLWKEFPDQIEPFADAAIAVAVVWDDEASGPYRFSDNVALTRSIMPKKLVGAVENFGYLVDNDKAFEGRPRHLPWEFLVYVVDHDTPLAERKWAQRYFKKANGSVKSFHQDVPYDHDMLKGLQEKDPKIKPHLEGHEYTLENIHEKGGICGQQADFAARVGKSVCLPSAFCYGTSAFRGLHGWCLYADVKKATSEKITFSLVSDGRYRGFLKDAFYTGKVKDPKTGKPMLDRDMERRLWVVGTHRIAKRQADLVMRAYSSLCNKLDVDLEAKVKYIDSCLKLSPHNEAAWQMFSSLAQKSDLTDAQKKVVLTHVIAMNKTFADYPDFIWQEFDKLIIVQPDKKERVALYQTVETLFEKHGRADLACDASLKIADLLAEQEQWETAGKGLFQTIKKFPTEGRYVPQITLKLQAISKNHKGGADSLAKLYVDLVPKMVLHYREEGTKYCDEMYEQALKFLTDNKYDKLASELKVKTKEARALVRAK